MLKTRDSGKNPSIESLMKLKDARHNTAYDDFLIILDSVKRLYGKDGKRIITRFETVLEKPNDPLTKQEMIELEQQRLNSVLTAGAADALPAGWVEETDPASSRPYYVNTATVQSVWERPVSTVPHSAAAGTNSSLLEPGGRNGQGKQAPGSLPFLPAGFYHTDFKKPYVQSLDFELIRDPNTKVVYYYNRNTRETRTTDNPPQY